MRRFAPIVLPILLLAGCASYVGNPADGLGGFLGDTFSWRGNSNRPSVDSANARRVMGVEVEAEPLREESGNIWPGPLPPARSMSDLQRDLGGTPAPIDAMPARGSSTPLATMAAPPAAPRAIAPQPAPQPAVQLRQQIVRRRIRGIKSRGPQQPAFGLWPLIQTSQRLAGQKEIARAIRIPLRRLRRKIECATVVVLLH